MVDFRNPVVEVTDFRTLLNLFHTVAGLYIWEFATTLDYEWNAFRGHRPYRWTIWIYSLTRVAALVAVTLVIVDFNSKTSYSCQALITLNIVFCCVAYAAAELLIVLRIIAIWNKQRVVVAISFGIWVVNSMLLIQAMMRLRSQTFMGYCLPRNVRINILNNTSILVTDVVLLLIMLVGLLPLRIQRAGSHSLGDLLWTQGIIWVFIATIAGVMPVIFLFLNLNDSWNTMFLYPSLVATTVAATRMHRSLTDFVSRIPEIQPDDLRGGGSPTLSSTDAPALHIPHKRMEVIVHSTTVQSPTEMSDRGSYTDTEGRVTFKPPKLAED